MSRLVNQINPINTVLTTYSNDEQKEYDWDDPNTQSIADDKLSLFLFEHGLAWNPFQSKEWKEFMNIINPKYKCISSKKISNGMLDKIDLETQALVIAVKLFLHLFFIAFFIHLLIFVSYRIYLKVVR